MSEKPFKNARAKTCQSEGSVKFFLKLPKRFNIDCCRNHFALREGVTFKVATALGELV